MGLSEASQPYSPPPKSPSLKPSQRQRPGKLHGKASGKGDGLQRGYKAIPLLVKRIKQCFSSLPFLQRC